jgi:dynein heavy chain
MPSSSGSAKLSTVGDVVEMWLVVQNMWMYMEAVFSGGDIVKQLPQEAKRFNQIDKAFTKMPCTKPWTP